MYHAWRNHDGQYEDVPGFCAAANADEIAKHDFVLTPGRYVGADPLGVRVNESTVELAALEYLRQLGYSTQFGPNLAPGGASSERASFEQVYLYDRLRIFDLEDVDSNDWLAVNQFTVLGDKTRRPDVVVFVNGVPLGLFELKNAASEHATLRTAWNQIQTYRTDLPALFVPNALCVISDGTSAAMSSYSGYSSSAFCTLANTPM